MARLYVCKKLNYNFYFLKYYFILIKGTECKKYPDEDMFHFPDQKSVKKITKIIKKKTSSKATGQPTTSKVSKQRSASKTANLKKPSQSEPLATKKTNESTFESKSLSTIITRSKSVAKK